MRPMIKDFLADANGATAVEYALIGALVFLAAVGAMQAMGASAGDMWAKITTAITKAGEEPGG